MFLPSLTEIKERPRLIGEGDSAFPLLGTATVLWAVHAAIAPVAMFFFIDVAWEVLERGNTFSGSIAPFAGVLVIGSLLLATAAAIGMGAAFGRAKLLTDSQRSASAESTPPSKPALRVRIFPTLFAAYGFFALLATAAVAGIVFLVPYDVEARLGLLGALLGIWSIASVVLAFTAVLAPRTSREFGLRLRSTRPILSRAFQAYAGANLVGALLTAIPLLLILGFNSDLWVLPILGIYIELLAVPALGVIAFGSLLRALVHIDH